MKPCGLVADLRAFVAIPTVSAAPDRKKDMREGAHWLARRVWAAGFSDVQVVSAGGAPAVVGRWDVDERLPTLLLYGHYDVVPTGDLANWAGPPFLLREVDGRLAGRGTSDDKAFVLAQLEAVRRLAGASAVGRAPLNLRCLYEGEEEIGSRTLETLLVRGGRQLRAAAAVVCDTESAADDRVSITLSCRGGITTDVEVSGPSHDLHAGRFGGAVRQPAQVLAEIVGTIHDQWGRVQLPGFYDRVRPVRDALPDDRRILKAAGVNQGWGEPGFSAGARVAARPAVIITRLISGAPGTGVSHVIPATASAQLNVRLVADQDPGLAYRSIARHVDHHARAGGDIRARTKLLLSARPWEARSRHPAIRAAACAVRSTTGAAPAPLRSGGSIPALALLEDQKVVATSAVLGFAQAEDRAHGPNESVDPRRISLAAGTVFSLLERYATAP
jgi:acetylornithine deacetylase/succinyl-diaminopimelate desuccinylase-like protein